MGTFTTKYLPLIVMVLTTVATAFSSNVQSLWSAHPMAAGTVSSLLTVAALFFPQPHK